MGIIRGGNKSGVKWNKGGRLARGKMLDIDFYAFADLADKLDRMGADMPKAIADAMEHAAKTVAEDTRSAMASDNLPAKGKHSQGDTEESIITDPKAEMHGTYITINLGFDKTKAGAGGFLITGTPKMKPDYKLEDIYGRRKYISKIMKQIRTDLQKVLDELGG